MPNEDSEFGTIEIELHRLLMDTKTLKENIQKYESSSDQLASGKEVFTSGADAINNQLSSAGKQLSEAANQLRPIGTTQIIDALEKLETSLHSTTSKIEESLTGVTTVASCIESSGSKLEQTANNLQENNKTLTEAQTDRLIKCMQEFANHFESKFASLQEKIDAIEDARINTCSKTHKELLDAVELSAPKGIFRNRGK